MTITALSDIAGLRLWVEADLNTGFAEGADVTPFWPEAGAVGGATGDLGPDAGNPHPPSWHAGSINGLPVVRFVGNDWATVDEESVVTGAGGAGRLFYYDVGDPVQNLATASSFTVFVLARFVLSTSYPLLSEFDAFRASGSFGIEFWNRDEVGAAIPTIYVWAAEAGATQEECYFPWPFGEWALVEAWYDGVTFSVQVSDQCAGGVQTRALGALDSDVGQVFFGINAPVDGDYGEVAGAGVYQPCLTADDRREVRQYFADKYRLDLCSAARRRSRVGLLK